MPVVRSISACFGQFGRKRFWTDRRGSIAVIAAFAVSLLVGMAGIAVDLSRMMLTKANLQNIADHLALAGAREMQLRQRDVTALQAYLEDRAREAVAETGLHAHVTATIDPQERSVRINFEGHPETLLVQYFQRAGAAIAVEAIAMSVGGEYPLCLVTLDNSAQHSMQFSARTRVDATGCAFYANSRHSRAVQIQGNATLEASLLCSAGGIATTGAFVSRAHRETDCPPIADPLRDRTLPRPGPCLLEGRTRISDRRILDPGTYCGAIDLRPGADVELRPGTYIFAGSLRIHDGARLSGDGVHLHFHGLGPDHNIVFNVHREAHISLTAPRHGSMAGLLMTGRESGASGQRYYFGSAHAPLLTGTIYLPNGHFFVGSGVTIADRSPFTIIVARSFTLQQGPELSFEGGAGFVLNTDYHLSDIPVPPGLGPNGGSIVLTR